MEISIENCGSFTLNKVARAANGAVLYKNGDAVILAVVAIDTNAIIEGDFLPLTVQYIEKAYANGKFPGGFIKREGKPNEFEILTSRLIDRSLRPLFSKKIRHPIQVSVFVLSADRELDLQVLALNAASAALLVSNLPFQNALNALRIARIEGEFVLNPTNDALSKSSIDLFVAGEGEHIFMIEFKACAEELSEAELLSALNLAQKHIKATSDAYATALLPHKKPPLALESQDLSLESGESAESKCGESYESFKSKYAANLENCLAKMAKSESLSALNALTKDIAGREGTEAAEVERFVARFRRDFVRGRILTTQTRLDGRGLDEIREINIATNLLPSAHGSALFSRGETQVLAVCTIGGEFDMQTYEPLTAKTPQKSGFLFHYNFPSFCTAEAYPIGSPSRRELGHGNLVKKALESSLRGESRAVRVVSEVLESNGSSSMASVCAGSLSLFAAGLEPQFMVAGVAMGLVKSGESCAILTDITGLEDAEGDMDFKVAGNARGITALQMDIKITEIPTEILAAALERARCARLKILEKMAGAKIAPSKAAPKALTLTVPTHKIAAIIGVGGRNIKEIIERFNITIDINKESGEVRLNGQEAANLAAAREHILGIANAKIEGLKVGERFSGKIKRVADFGIFVEVKSGIDGLVHNSKLQKRGAKLSDFSEGGVVEVEIEAINGEKIELGLC